jgi:tetratricopeptide (TPR) repeat protein
VHLVLGRALVEQSRVEDAKKEFAAAEGLFESLGSVSHVAAAWMAQGDLYGREGELDAALALFRRAAEALQDFNF